MIQLSAHMTWCTSVGDAGKKTTSDRIYLMMFYEENYYSLTRIFYHMNWDLDLHHLHTHIIGKVRKEQKIVVLVLLHCQQVTLQ